MKKFCILILVVISTHVFAQDSLKMFTRQRYRTTTTGMEILGSWGIANMAIGGAGWANSQGGQNKYFYQMTFIWGAANLGAAILGYTGAQKEKDKTLNDTESLEAQRKIEKVFLVNGVLDMVYIGAGAFLKHRGDNRDN